MLDRVSKLHEIKSAALEEVHSAIAIADAQVDDLPIVYVNPAFEKLTGYQRHEIVGRNCRFLQGPDTDLAAVRKLRQAIDEKRPAHAVLRNYRKDGSAFINEIFINPIRDRAGRTIYFVGCQNAVDSPEMAAMRAEGLDRMATLSRRERQVFEGLVRGATIKEIALREDLSPRTLEKYRYRMQRKMGTNSLAILVRYAIATGLEFKPY